MTEKLREYSLLTDTDLLSFELDALEDLIELEPKHYNAWSHRMFLANTFKLFETTSELEFTRKYIDKDLRNNSAWSYRRHALSYRQNMYKEELEKLCVDKIRLAPSNESAWVYATSFPGWQTNQVFTSMCQALYADIQASGKPLSSYTDFADTLVELLLFRNQTIEAAEILNTLAESNHIRAPIYKLRRDRLVIRK